MRSSRLMQGVKGEVRFKRVRCTREKKKSRSTPLVCCLHFSPSCARLLFVSSLPSSQKMKILQRVEICTKPQTPLGQWILWKHQVLRVYFVPPGEDRGFLGGLLGISILISMLVMFMFWHTSAICKQQDACNELCSDSKLCTTSISSYGNMSVNILHQNTSVNYDAWPSCLQSASDWQSKPGNVRLLTARVDRLRLFQIPTG